MQTLRGGIAVSGFMGVLCSKEVFIFHYMLIYRWRKKRHKEDNDETDAI